MTGLFAHHPIEAVEQLGCPGDRVLAIACRNGAGNAWSAWDCVLLEPAGGDDGLPRLRHPVYGDVRRWTGGEWRSEATELPVDLFASHIHGRRPCYDFKLDSRHELFPL